MPQTTSNHFSTQWVCRQLPDSRCLLTQSTATCCLIFVNMFLFCVFCNQIKCFSIFVYHHTKNIQGFFATCQSPRQRPPVPFRFKSKAWQGVPCNNSCAVIPVSGLTKGHLVLPTYTIPRHNSKIVLIEEAGCTHSGGEETCI